jgi:hypothetical protein
MSAATGLDAADPSPFSSRFPAGLYSPAERTVFIPEETLERSSLPLEEVLAHELTHALDDQHFDLGESPSGQNSESAAAARALDEGSATLIEQRYMRRFLGGAPTATELLADAYHAYDPASHLETARASLPYLLGLRFVSALHRRGGPRLVDQAFRDRPTTMGQVAHPLRWLRGDSYVRPALLEPGPTYRWQTLGTGPFTEADTNLLLQSAFAPLSSRQAAEGLDGGRWAVWRERATGDDCAAPCPAHTVVTIAWRWENANDAVEFARAVHGILELGLHAPRLGGRVWEVDGGYAGIAGRASRRVDGTEVVAPTWVLVFAPSPHLARKAARTTSMVASTGGQFHRDLPKP